MPCTKLSLCTFAFFVPVSEQESPRGVWNLMLGDSRELGSYCLELYSRPAYASQLLRMTRLVQLNHSKCGRKVALVKENQLHFLRGTDSLYRLAQSALAAHKKLEQAVAESVTNDSVDYNTVHTGQSDPIISRLGPKHSNATSR